MAARDDGAARRAKQRQGCLRVRPSASASRSSRGIRHASARGRTVWTHRTDGPVSTRSTDTPSNMAAEASACIRPFLESGRSRSSSVHALGSLPSRGEPDRSAVEPDGSPAARTRSWHVRQHRPGLLRRDPPELVHLGAGDERASGRVHQPVPHRLRAVLAVRVLHGDELGPELAPKPGLLQDLSRGVLLVVLVVFGLPLGNVQSS